MIASPDTVAKAKRMQPHVRRVNVANNMLSGEVASEDESTIYTPSVKETGEIMCGCPAGSRQRACWHLCAIFITTKKRPAAKNFIRKIAERYIDETPPSPPKEQEDDNYIMTGMEGFDSLVGGLAKAGALAVVGPYRSGKTILNIQLACITIKETGKNALIVDTEGNLHAYRHWGKVFDKRYDIGMDLSFTKARLEKDTISVPAAEHKKSTLFVVDVRNIEKILALHGRHAKLGFKGGKMTLIPEPNGWKEIPESPIGRLINKNTVGFLGYDSITAPLLDFGTERQNFPARANATNLWLLQVEKAAEEFGCVVVGILHESVDPTSTFSKPKHTGGKSVGYTFKSMIYITHLRSGHTPSTSKRPEYVREIWNMRHPYKAPWQTYQELELCDEGFRDYKR